MRGISGTYVLASGGSYRARRQAADLAENRGPADPKHLRARSGPLGRTDSRMGQRSSSRFTGEIGASIRLPTEGSIALPVESRDLLFSFTGHPSGSFLSAPYQQRN